MEFDFSFFAFSNWETITNYAFRGLKFSVLLTIAATIGGIFFGTLLALMRLSGIKVLQWIALIYVNTLRAIPLMMVLLWFFLLVPFIIGMPLGDNTTATITFIAFEAAYFSEIVRAGIQSVAKGQFQAGLALGMNYRQNMAFIILPQAFRNMIPVFLTQVIVLFQDTSLVYVIGAYDMLKGFSVLGSTYGNTMEAYVLAALVYFVICFTLSQLAKAYQKRIAIIR